MKLNVTLPGGDCPRTFKLEARLGWMLFQLAEAGARGVTAFERPAARISANIHSLRRMGFPIITEMEPHEGAYSGRHTRYRLACDVRLTVREGEARQ